SKLKASIAQVLKQEGYIEDFALRDNGVKKELAIALKYYAGRPVIERLERVSKPGLRVYKGRNDIPRVMNGLGVAILSTSRGVMTGGGLDKGFGKGRGLGGGGFRGQAQGDKLDLSLGFSHPVVQQMPKGIKVATPTQTEIVITGVDKQLVGQVAAEVRAQRA